MVTKALKLLLVPGPQVESLNSSLACFPSACSLLKFVAFSYFAFYNLWKQENFFCNRVSPNVYIVAFVSSSAEGDLCLLCVCYE
jgi:hypothetical protein